jgi:glucose uptake protein GlcU
MKKQMQISKALFLETSKYMVRAVMLTFTALITTTMALYVLYVVLGQWPDYRSFSIFVTLTIMILTSALIVLRDRRANLLVERLDDIDERLQFIIEKKL